jgi:hypothetical protein
MEATVDPPFPGSRLDADHPKNGVLIPCLITYHLITLVNVVSGRDELELALELFRESLVPTGVGILTFFHCDSYNVGAADLNPDFPMLTEYDLDDALRRQSGLLLPVTEPRWRSDRPMLCIDPFAMPPFGTLTVARTSSRANAVGS